MTKEIKSVLAPAKAKKWLIGGACLLFVLVLAFVWLNRSFDVPPQDSISVSGTVISSSGDGLKVEVNGKTYQLEFTNTTKYDNRNPFPAGSSVRAYVLDDTDNNGTYKVIDIKHTASR